jgi:hypothetical protein
MKDILTIIIYKIRVISEISPQYDTSSKVADLLKKVSIQLLHKFIERVKKNLVNIKTDYSEELHNDIKAIREVIREWKSLNEKFREGIRRQAKLSIQKCWMFTEKEKQDIFYDLEAFEKRCQNLEDICLCQLQFGKKKNLPPFGGVKSFEIIKQLKDIEEKFDDQMNILFNPHNRVEEIKVNRWQEDYRNFSKFVEDLEDMYKNTISSVFKRVNTLEEAVNYVHNFYTMAKLPKIKNFIENEIAAEILNIYSEELENMKIKNDNKAFVRSMRQTIEGGNVLWAKSLFLRMEDYAKCLNRMNQIFNPKKPKEEHKYMKTKKYDELNSQINQLTVTLKSYLTGEHPEIKDELEKFLKINDNTLEEKLQQSLVVPYNPPEEKPFFQLYQCNYPIELLRLYATNNCFQRIEEFPVPPEIYKKVIDLEERTRPLKENVLTTVRDYNNLVLSITNEIEHAIFQEDFQRMIVENINRIQYKNWNSIGNETILNKFKRRIEEVTAKINQFKANTEAIYEICETISKRTFFAIDRSKEIYEKQKFVEEQKQIREANALFINARAKDILELIIKSYKNIEHSTDPEVFKGFRQYLEAITEKGDKSFLCAVEKVLTNSIINMDRAMFGYKGTPPTPFLKINVEMLDKKAKKDIIIYE